MNYTTQDKPWPRGEIWIRGPSCFVGYYKDEEKTKQSLTADGWVISGDIGEIDGQGRLRIIDRKKSLLKLAQGEYVSPEKVENTLAHNPLIAQAFVEGDSLKPYVIAVIVPDMETLEPWAKNQGIIVDDAYNNPKLKEQLLKEIAHLGSHGGSNKLKGFEIPKDIHIEKIPFTVENGLLTPTYKIKREVARVQYRPVIQELYAEEEVLTKKSN